MEVEANFDSSRKDSATELPLLLQNISVDADSDFDGTSTIPRGEPSRSHISGAAKITKKWNSDILHSPVQVIRHQLSHKRKGIGEQHKESISMPSSPSGFNVEQASKDLFGDGRGENGTNGQAFNTNSFISADVKQFQKSRFYSPPSGNPNPEPNLEAEVQHEILKDKKFDSFKTWSGKLERMLPNLEGKPQHEVEYAHVPENIEPEGVPPVERYFEALEGPELEILRPSEHLVLPEDKKWPFLLRFPISCFGICLGVSSQAILWKTLATSPSMSFLHISLHINLVLWCISLALTSLVSIIYVLKFTFYFEAVRREYYHPIRVNFFFAPWIVCLFLVLGAPSSIVNKLQAPLWYVLMTPILCLELKIYGQWMSGGDRRLSKVANPTNHVALVGNFIGALLGANMGLKEGPIFFFAVGVAHYIVLFVTLYQRLPSNETLPRDLHPVFFLFVAGPCVACMSWAKINDDFGYGSRMALFVGLFLYLSLVVRINFFRGFRFSLAWWAYTTPMSGAAVAAIRYSTEVKIILTQILALALTAVSTITASAMLVSTMVHAFVLHNLFPNDVSIAITDRPPMSRKWRKHRKSASSEENSVESSLSAAS